MKRDKKCNLPTCEYSYRCVNCLHNPEEQSAPKRIRWTAGEKRYALSALENHVPVWEIAEKLGKSEPAVRAFFRNEMKRREKAHA